MMHQDLTTLRNTAEALFEAEKFTDLVALLPDDVLEQYNDAALFAWRARAHHRLSDAADRTMLYAQKSIDLDGNYFMGYFARACAWYNKGEYDKAIEDDNKAIDLKPDFAVAYFNRGNSWHNKGQYDKAIEDYNKAIDLKPDYADAYYNRGNSWFKKDQYNQAIKDYGKAIDLKPDSADTYHNRGLSWHNKGEYDQAIEDYNRAIELKSDYADAYYNRGVSWDNKDQYDKAIKDYNKTIELKPDYATAYYGLGYSLYRQDEYDQAIRHYNKAIELEPDYASAYTNRGNIYALKSQYDKAIEDYNKAVALKPNDAITYYNRGNSWYNKGQEDKAIEDFKKAIELNPNYADAYNNRGSSWAIKGKYDKAIEDYDTAISLKSDYALAYYNRGNASKLSGKDLKSSIADFEEYLKLAPDKLSILATHARDSIQELKEQVEDPLIGEVANLIKKIKDLLLAKEKCITHYTGLKVAKTLILDLNSKFRLSEGAFLNDTSEGTELFKFLNYSFYTKIDGLIAETFAPKPFIGSFVAEEKHDDLNLWRFYGKENGIEAKGCAITLHMKDLMEAIKNSITIRMKEIMDANKNSITKDSPDKPSIISGNDINFYHVAYMNHQDGKTTLHIPNAKPGVEERLNNLMDELKDKVKNYKNEDKSVLEKYLNTIAYLFKNDAYKNENEIRLVIKGVEFKKEIDQDAYPPRVYIELVNIRNLIKQITLGPKVEKADEWTAAFHYSYENLGSTDKRPEKIVISRLPYK